jgi:hypothetical protein
MKSASDKIDLTSELTNNPDQRYTKHTIQNHKQLRYLYRNCKTKNTKIAKK